jgi:hypothetical protein
MCHFQLPPDNLLEQVGKWPAILVCCGGAAPIVVVMLRQSLKHFRRATLPGRTLVECSLVLVMLVLLITVWWIDGVTSIIQLPGSQPVQELKHALNALALTDPPSAQPRTRAVTPQELEGGISEQTRIWLRNAVVSYTRLPAPTVKTGYRQTSYQASVVFPNGRSFLFGGGDSADPFRRRYGFQ